MYKKFLELFELELFRWGEEVEWFMMKYWNRGGIWWKRLECECDCRVREVLENVDI